MQDALGKQGVSLAGDKSTLKKRLLTAGEGAEYLRVAEQTVIVQEELEHPQVKGTHPDPPQSGLPCVLTVEELANLLRVNRDTAYKAVAEGRIPGVRRVGRSIRISREAVLDWLRGKDHVPRSKRRSA
ncbi:MAG: helix-turn-helix domain-containing protein [Nitrospinota bacterium]